MNTKLITLAAGALLLAGSLAGCKTQTTPPAEVQTPAEPQASPPTAASEPEPARPAAKKPTLTRVQQGAFSLPGMECLVNQHGIRIKVLVVREGARCLDRAPAGAAIDPPLQHFRPYFVFDVHPREGDVKFYQVGPTPRRDSIVGWVPAEAVARWPTRIGARCRRAEGERVPPLLVYPSREALVELLQTGSTRTEPIARAVARAGRAFMPWPIGEVVPATVNGQVHELVQLHFIGELPRDGLDPAPASAAEEPAYSAEEVRAIQTRIRQLDLVFVLDVTGSMQPYINAAKETIRDISRRLRDLDFQPDIAFGLVAYRDHDRDSGFVTRHFDLERDYEKFLGRIAGLKAGAGGDSAEAIYDGVHDALEKSTWRGQGLSARVLVLIGDASAHEPGDPQNPHNISRDHLVEMARKHRAKLFALAVGDSNKDRDLMWEQFSDLARRTRGECLPIADASTVVERMRPILREESATVGQRARVLEDLAKGKLPERIAAERDLDLRQVTEIMEFLKGAGIDVRRLQPGVPTYASGWALSEVHGVPILEREVYLARSELDVLLGGLNLLCSRLSPDLGRQAFGLGIGGRVNPLASFFEGDVPEPLDVFLMAKGIPVGRSSILQLSAVDVRYMPEERRATLRERIARTIIPELVNARNNDALWDYRGDLEFGWIPERILP